MGKEIATVLLPCLNEERTLLKCCNEIKKVLDKSKYKNKYKILVCDNGSTDKSVSICKKNKIDYIIEKHPGYGNAILAGIKAAKTKYVVMLDCDLSYDAKDIPEFISELEAGNDMVVGNRFHGTIEEGAMPLSHRIGSRILTKYANILFRTHIKDFHCGIRSFDRKKLLKTGLEAPGFEFASEMIIRAKTNKLKLKEIKTNLFKDGRNRKPHLRTIRDGFRHLHKINFLKFASSKPFRYTTTFIFSIIALFAFTVGSCMIPHDAIKDNAIQSTKELLRAFDDNNKLPARSYRRFEMFGDIRNYAMAFATNPSDPVRSAVEMNYLAECNFITKCSETLEKNKGRVVSYSRYWQGQSSTLHYTMPFMTVNTATFFFTVLFVILLLYTLYKIFREDKALSLALLLGLLSVNISFVTRSLEFLPVFFVMLITILLVLKARKDGGKNLDLIFLLSGVATCYFDFLTCETIVITVPLIIYSYLEIKAGNKVGLKKLLPLMILWGLGYALTFGSKWLISFMFMGPESFADTFSHMTSHSLNISIFSKITSPFVLSFKTIFPFAFIDSGVILAVFLIIICLIYTLSEHKNMLVLYLICLIPFLRFWIINGHSIQLNYFTYRALICLIMVLILTIWQMIKNTFESKS